jgi:hypothetical protein
MRRVFTGFRIVDGIQCALKLRPEPARDLTVSDRTQYLHRFPRDMLPYAINRSCLGSRTPASGEAEHSGIRDLSCDV